MKIKKGQYKIKVARYNEEKRKHARLFMRMKFQFTFTYFIENNGRSVIKYYLISRFFSQWGRPLFSI